MRVVLVLRDVTSESGIVNLKPHEYLRKVITNVRWSMTNTLLENWFIFFRKLRNLELGLRTRCCFPTLLINGCAFFKIAY